MRLVIEVLVDQAQIKGAVGTAEQFKEQLTFAVSGALNQMRTQHRNSSDLDFEVTAEFKD